MTVKYKTVITKAGAIKLAAATVPNGKKVNFTAMAIGDGGGTLPTPDANQTKLINERWRNPLNKISQDAKNKNYVVAELLVPPERGGFWMREMGLYDDTGTLIAVGNMAESYKPELAEGSGRAQTVRMVIMVSDIESVELTIDTSMVMATQDYVDDKLAEHELSRNHPDATLKEKGFTQLSNATDSESESVAATPKAVKAAYDLAKGKYTAQDATTAQKGITQLSSATDSDSETVAATSKAVKAAKESITKKLGTASEKDTGTSGDKVPLLSGVNTWGAEQVFNERVNVKGGFELYHDTPYIDFHFANSTVDYTSRIIESAKGTLTAQANWSVSGTLASAGLASFKSGVDVTGRYGNISVNGMALLIKPTTAGYATYIMSQDLDGSNLWYIGKGSANVNDAVFNNYKASNNRIELKADGSVNVTSSNAKSVGVNNQLKITAQDAIKIVQGDYGAIIRRSENNLYIIPTAKGDAENGAIGKLRPFSIALDTGIVSMGHGLTLGAALPIGSGGTGSTTAAGARTALGCGAAATMSYSTADYTGLAGSLTEAASTKQLVGLRDAVYTKTAGDARYQLKNTASKAANGWYKDTSTGLIFQWGQASGAANAKITVTFPIAFPNACLNASLTDIWPQLSMYTAAINAKTATTLSVGLATTSVFWYAIGY